MTVDSAAGLGGQLVLRWLRRLASRLRGPQAAAPFWSGRRDLLTAVGTATVGLLGEPGRALSAAANGNQARKLTPLDFGAVGDGVTDDRAAISAAVSAALAGNGCVYLPAGFTFGIDVTKGPIDIDVGWGKTFTMIGDGTASLLKRLDVASPLNRQQMFRLIARGGDGGAALFGNFFVNDNARGSPLANEKDAPYELEHSHVFFLTDGPNKIGRVVFDTVWFTDPVADCISCGRADGRIIVDTLICSNIQVIERNRVRSDITVTGGLGYLVVDKFRGFSLEAELNKNPDEPVSLSISNVVTKRLDLSGNAKSNLTRVKLANVYSYGETMFGNIRLDAVNCEFRMVNKPWLYAMGSNSSLINCTFWLPLDAQGATRPLRWHVEERWRAKGELGGQPTYEHCTLQQCRIMIDQDEAISKIDFAQPADGALLDRGNGVPWPWAGANIPTLVFDGCYFDRRAACMASAPRGGKWVFHRCQMAGTAYSFRYVSHADYVVQLEFYDCDWSNVSNAIIEFGGGDGAKGNYLRWSERFMEESLSQKLSRGKGSSTYRMGTHVSDRRIVSTSPPDGRTRCLRADVWVRVPPLPGEANEWVAVDTVADEKPTDTQWLAR